MMRACCLVAALACATAARPQAIPVELVQDARGAWTMLRGGRPYFVEGAGGPGSIRSLAEAGGNSVRTWSSDGVAAVLDSAQAVGVTVMVGLWMGHERHGFNYRDDWARRDQLARFTEVVRTYRNHPALLCWGVGNEVDLFYTDLNVWSAVQDVAAMIHREDPLHPTVVVTAGIDVAEVALIGEHCPDVDLLGVNTYGAIGALKEDIALFGWKKPYLVTEWGATGHWEVAKAAWGAPIEESSSLKAERYRERYRTGVLGDPDRCLGSYAFLWGQKQETTPTWYGVYLEDGRALGPVDAMTEAWTGRLPEQQAPVWNTLRINGSTAAAPFETAPGARLSVAGTWQDPDGDAITVRWEIVPESTDIKAGGDRESRPPTYATADGTGPDGAATLRAPFALGPYRLFAYLDDGQGKAAVWNVPFLVR